MTFRAAPLLLPLLVLSAPALADGTDTVTRDQVSAGYDSVGARVDSVLSDIDMPAPRFVYAVGTEIYDDLILEDEDGPEYNSIVADFEAALALELRPDEGLFATLKLEQVRPQDEDNIFEDQGLFVEELYGRVRLGDFGLRAGKFNPAFGVAWDAAPGIYGDGFANLYETTGVVGIGAATSFAALDGLHTLEASTFFHDTSFLSDSFGTSRGDLDVEDGGPANTESLGSGAIQLSGTFEDYGYAIAAQYLAGEDGTEDQTGISAAILLGFSLGEDSAIDLVLEVAAFDGFGGADETAIIGTFGAKYRFGDVAVSGAYAFRDIEETGHLLTASAQYAFSDSLTASVGYRYIKDESDSHTVGVQAIYTFGGGFAFAD